MGCIILPTPNKIIDIDNKIDSIPINITITSHDNSNNKILQIQKLKTATNSSAYIVKDTYVDNIINLFNNCNDNMEPNKLSG